MKYKVRISNFVFGVSVRILMKYNPEQFEIVDFLNNPKDTCVGGKATYARVLIRYK